MASDASAPGARTNIDAVAPPFWRSLLVAAIVITGLYVGREVLVPIVLAVLLSFVLAIPVGLLQRFGLGRIFPVGFVVVLAFAAIFGTGAVLTSQLTDLAVDLPRYQTTIHDKITSLRDAAGSGSPVSRVVDMVQSLGEDLSPPVRPEPNAGERPALRPHERPPATTPSAEKPAKPIAVEIAERPSTPLQTAEAILSPLLHPLATTGLVALFVVFILLQRGDLRNRFIRLVGSHDLQRTTVAMNDAASRLARFFLTQVLLNGAFGLIVGIGLWFIGVPSPVLWGIFGAVARFVPYIGAISAAALPTILALAVDPNWSMAVETLVMFAVVELVIGQIVEPFAYGHSTGLSPVAVIASVTFWTWIWGPIGLLLATPLTVCLVVLGRHVEQMAFLDVMFGDRPPLTEPETFYQRILAGDPTEPTEQAETLLRQHALTTYYYRVALRGLAMAQADAERGTLDEARLEKIDLAVTDLIDNLDDYEDEAPAQPTRRTNANALDGDEPVEPDPPDLPRLKPEELRPEWREGAPVLCVAGRNALDRASAAILAQLLGKHGISADAEGPEALSAGGIVKLPSAGRRLICVAYLDASSPVHARYAVRRLRRRAPDACIMLAAWGLGPDEARNLGAAARADHCVATLRDAVSICLAEAGIGAGAAEPTSEPIGERPAAATSDLGVAAA